MPNDALTPRQIEVLQACFDHNGDKDAAADSLFISRETLRCHLSRNIYPKLMVNCLTGAIRVGLALNVINVEQSFNQFPPLYLSNPRMN